jgi:hypothetical protein
VGSQASHSAVCCCFTPAVHILRVACEVIWAASAALHTEHDMSSYYIVVIDWDRGGITEGWTGVLSQIGSHLVIGHLVIGRWRDPIP